MLPYPVRSYAIPKAGNDFGDYEDAACIGRPSAQRPRHRPSHRCLAAAVADGATESSFAALWARLLVEAYVQAPARSASVLRQHVETCAAAWQAEIGGRPLAWYAEEKARMGAFSTLLGLLLEPRGKGMGTGFWHATAVGDTCLFQVRGDALLTAFPLARASDFSNTPLLLSSNLARNASVWEGGAVRCMHGEWQYGDDFLIATDALSAWLAAQGELGEAPWNVLLGFAEEAHENFVAWVVEQRTAGLMKNDDVTLVHIRMVRDAAA